jgi:hypothetical protein
MNERLKNYLEDVRKLINRKKEAADGGKEKKTDARRH